MTKNIPVVPEKRLYTASATSTGGRAGRVVSSDGVVDFSLSLPKELGGNGGPGTNPEQLFASGYAACFGTGLSILAAKQHIETGPVSIRVDVSIGPVGAGFGLAVEITAHLPELKREQAEALVHATHEICPYSVATRGNVPVELRIADK
jgi:Ohr subfamily peroxiredoxin